MAFTDQFVALMAGLTNVAHSVDTTTKIVPFPPGHFEVFDLKLNGKVKPLRMDQFHCCTNEPAHAQYDPVERLLTGTEMSTACLITFLSKPFTYVFKE